MKGTIEQIKHTELVIFKSRIELEEYILLTGDKETDPKHWENYNFPQIQSKHWSNHQSNENFLDTLVSKKSILSRLESFSDWKIKRGIKDGN